MKTWEIRKMIDENPNEMRGKKFRLTKGILYEYGRISVGEIAKVTEFKSLTDLSRNGWRIGDLTGFEEWEEIKEPVTWQEAFKAGLEGKKIKPKGQYLTFPDYEDLLYTFKYLTERPGYFKKVMLDDWYIED